MRWKMNVVVIQLCLGIMLSHKVQSLFRCFKCRSRGELGTCRDPFGSNETVHGIKLETCLSGWCAKLIEGSSGVYRTDDYGVATQRMCLKEGPSDGEERCGPVMVNHKKVFMCFCRSDMCNNAFRFALSPMNILIPTLVIFYSL